MKVYRNSLNSLQNEHLKSLVKKIKLETVRDTPIKSGYSMQSSFFYLLLVIAKKCATYSGDIDGMGVFDY